MQSLDAALVSAYGSRILEMLFPLFPSTADFAHLNTRLLQSWSAGAATGGGGHDNDHDLCARMFRDDPHGAGHLPVVQHEGNWVVDTTPVEAAFDNLWQQVGRLSDEVRRLHETKTIGDVKPIADAILARITELRDTVSKVRNTTRSLQPTRGTGNRGRGGARGGRGSRGRDF